MTIAEIIISAIVVVATVLIVATAVALWRAPGPLTRVNLLGPTTSVALPLLIAAKLLRDWTTAGFDLHNFLRAVLAIAGLWVIAAVGSFYMGRAVYGVSVEDHKQ
ncbi:Na+/H+ antiporter subunit G [Corynebacterium uberis]|uniref:Na+/H+ antiporter subunit G n=1 Tax=Corynebacterium TaxID=1716 RepID=UPI001D0A886A|nr:MULTISPECIES: Na+/H+ antiporter subunit G [Corynebacterium]MCZ9309930.1 Na+/H+ antiporter subunit G [Corynebacterium sp. c6VSa_13]UDL73149.1 Na+/H+ antiporter subunit G [Corynebacterium uberis]UDL75974.1 Na+/H+ antiporter subunit G [Corynebacterium uberis]UDL78186.1 Na+/H+ antiporter subunit G [Corynebacterium uberis]UDL80469.1 Na+/H+ antiporter subunit G [Corynebacterium uberis]